MRKFSIYILLFTLVSCASNEDKKNKEIKISEKEDKINDTIVEVMDGYTIKTIYLSDLIREELTYTPEGVLIIQQFLNNGLNDSITNMWYENGEKYAVVHWKNGMKNGKSIVWKQDGTIDREEEWKNDTLFKGTEIVMDTNMLVDYIAIIEDGKVVKKDYSKKGIPASELMK